MFFVLWRDIKYCEFKRLKNDDATFQLGSVVEDHETWFDKMLEREERKRGKLIKTYMFNIHRYPDEADESKFDVGQYRVKVYHMDDDEFRSKLYPLSCIDFIRYKWFNRKYFRMF